MGMIAISQQKFKLDTNLQLTLLQFLPPPPPVPCPTSQIEMTAGIDSGIFPSHDILVKSIEWLGNIHF